MAKTVAAPVAPVYLTGTLRERFDLMATTLAQGGTVGEHCGELLAKYILAENNYLQISNYVQAAIRDRDAEAADKWLRAQDRLIKQILSLGAELGITPKSRAAMGLPPI